ncbi:Potassium voltage-gated channel subfamily KQT [Enhygromyxa salina]|uniref:Potassium voltage-gated channel subfamily KQT n=1 Tax=Enhygromyxa salina TaxID=215803 RepID=A0A0C2D124_9BACT|nr:ion transporter [Enhygromyxa salina]KIG13842.1 Potassium voltage-gated channel subfamily KQT [Enhygromyxa salina]
MRFFDPESRPKHGWRARVYSVVFETDTPAGLLFDVLLLVAILLSITVISLETVTFFEVRHRHSLRIIEWILTGLFTIEYIVRLAIVREPKRYIFSFMGMVDLLSLLPTYLSLFFSDTQSLQIIRALRLLRVFRIFQLGRLQSEGGTLMRALMMSRYKIAVFLGTVLVIVVVQGALLYYLEHGVNEGFSSIPRSVYWAIVTLTTVGYGDISPVTVGGQFIASLLMLFGYGIIAVPTGIVGAEVAINEFTARIDARLAEQVVIQEHSKDSCAGSIPAFAIIEGPLDAGVTTRSRERT